jgi:hypothetical protein
MTSRHHEGAAMSKNVTPLGKMTAFYIPSHKLDMPVEEGDHSPRGKIHAFLIEHYKAYTHSPSPVKGFWLDDGGRLTHDVLERFEVSFGSEKEFSNLVKFLGQLCLQLDEAAIYLTRGEESFLVNHGAA